MEEERLVTIEEVNEVFKNKKIIEVIGLNIDSEEVIFRFKNNETIKIYHYQSCCESVYLEDIIGKKDLEGAIFYGIKEKACNKEVLNSYDESYTWTFYTIKTSKGYFILFKVH